MSILSCENFLQSVCLLNAGLENSRPNLVFEMCNDFIFGMLYSVCGTSASVDKCTSKVLADFQEILIYKSTYLMGLLCKTSTDEQKVLTFIL